MTIPTASAQFVLTTRSYWNPQGPTQRTLLNYSSADSLTAQGANSTNVTVPASTTGFTITPATLFPTLVLPLYMYVTDVTSPGLGFRYYFTSGAAAGAKQTVGPNGYFSWTGDGATAPNPIYIDNTTASVLILEIGIASN